MFDHQSVDCYFGKENNFMSFSSFKEKSIDYVQLKAITVCVRPDVVTGCKELFVGEFDFLLTFYHPCG